MRKKQKTNKGLPNMRDSINTYRQKFIDFSRTASNIARQLAFAEGAIFWILYTNAPSQRENTRLLLCVFFFTLILYFISDILQYLYTAFKYEQLASTLDSVEDQNPRKNLKFEHTDVFIQAPYTLYFLKFLFLLTSSLILIIMFVLFMEYTCEKTQLNAKNHEINEQTVIDCKKCTNHQVP